MATGVITDFKVYNPFINGSFYEQFMQNTDAFNAASAGAIVMGNEAQLGDYSYTSFFEEGPDVERRILTDVSNLTDNPATEDELITVKLHRRKHQATTRAQWAMVGKDPAFFGRMYGAQLDVAIRREMLNRCLAAVHAAISNVAALKFDGSGATMTTNDLVDGLALSGDAANEIVVWVMHSKPYYDLVKAQISANITGVSNLNVATATPVTLNRPVIITDSASLIISATASRYITLGLRRGAVSAIMSADPYTAVQEDTGQANIVIRHQTEYAYNLGVKGFKYDTGNGGANPTDAYVATAAYWDQAATDNKSLPGVWIRTN